MNTEELLCNKTSTELFEYLSEHFGITVPNEIITVDDMKEASSKLLFLTNEYSYIMELLSLAKIRCREAKRSGSKESYEDMVDKKEILTNLADSLKLQYSAISRAITIKIEMNAELRML